MTVHETKIQLVNQSRNKSLHEHIELMSTSNKSISTIDSNKFCIDQFKENILKDIANINNSLVVLTKRIKTLENTFVIKDFAGKLNKHYEQSRCYKRNL
ncbi:unnamed protein product [Diatraea saccharalis]|uniref:Uncharacterized protein n=1 Tax=Diatraea saccharalis TaxID=40085 RepID=A0A9N9R3M4_9NEOP|nr:unnamed protein product [Diatraea saccharalis]